MRLLAFSAAVLVALGLAACGGGGDTDQAAEQEGTETQSMAGEAREMAQDAQEKVEDMQDKAEEAAAAANPIVARSMKGDAGPAGEIALLKTNQGTIKIRFFPKQAPKTVANFKGLAAKDYYDGIIFHRVIQNFMMQGGDPTGTGRGGESLWGGKFEDEFDPALRFDRPGLLAMANAGPGTNGSQFFITQVPTPHLNDRHTIFGEVMEGMDVVNAICNAPTNNSRPVDRVVIEDIEITTE